MECAHPMYSDVTQQKGWASETSLDLHGKFEVLLLFVCEVRLLTLKHLAAFFPHYSHTAVLIVYQL